MSDGEDDEDRPSWNQMTDAQRLQELRDIRERYRVAAEALGRNVDDPDRGNESDGPDSLTSEQEAEFFRTNPPIYESSDDEQETRNVRARVERDIVNERNFPEPPTLDEYRQHMDDWFEDHIARSVSAHEAYYAAMEAGRKYRER